MTKKLLKFSDKWVSNKRGRISKIKERKQTNKPEDLKSIFWDVMTQMIAVTHFSQTTMIMKTESFSLTSPTNRKRRIYIKLKWPSLANTRKNRPNLRLALSIVCTWTKNITINVTRDTSAKLT